MTQDLQDTKATKLDELKAAQTKLRELQDELAVINSKISHDEPLTLEDHKFMSGLGWLATLSATIAAIAASV